jgi:hypothetical protein
MTGDDNIIRGEKKALSCETLDKALRSAPPWNINMLDMEYK